MSTSITWRRGATAVLAALAIGTVAGCGSDDPGEPVAQSVGNTASAGSTQAAAKDDGALPDYLSFLPTIAERKSFEPDERLRAKLPDEIRDAGKLRIGARPDAIPFAFFPEGSEQWQGFDAEIVLAVSELLGLEPELSKVDDTQSLLGIQSGRYDLAVGNIAETAERREQADFVNYRWNDFALVSLKDSDIDQLTDACGKKTPLTTGLVDFNVKLNGICKKAGKPAADVFELPDGATQTIALQSGRIEAYFWQTPQVRVQIAQGLDAKYFAVPEIGRTSIGLATPIGAKQLQSAVLAAIEELQSNGYYADVFERWDVTHLADYEPGINVGSKSDFYGDDDGVKKQRK